MPLDQLNCPETTEESGELTLQPGELPVGCAVSARAPAFVKQLSGHHLCSCQELLNLHSCKSCQLNSQVHRCLFFSLLLIPYLSEKTPTGVFLGFASPQQPPISFKPRFSLSEHCHLVLREFHNMARMFLL